MNTKVNEPIPVRPESLHSFLSSLAGGTFVDEVETEIRHTMKKVSQRGMKAKGKVVITLDFECSIKDSDSLFSEGQVNVTPDVKAILPRKIRASKAFFVTKEDEPQITKDNPETVGFRQNMEAHR